MRAHGSGNRWMHWHSPADGCGSADGRGRSPADGCESSSGDGGCDGGDGAGRGGGRRRRGRGGDTGPSSGRGALGPVLRARCRVLRARYLDESGAGTVLVLGIIGMLLAAMVGVTGLIQAQAAAGRARAASDLAALGGATALTSIVAPGDPCAVAGRVAQANGAEVTACTVAGEGVTVEATVGVRVLGVSRSATAAARAGPVDAP